MTKIYIFQRNRLQFKIKTKYVTAEHSRKEKVHRNNSQKPLNIHGTESNQTESFIFYFCRSNKNMQRLNDRWKFTETLFSGNFYFYLILIQLKQ